MQSNFDSLVDFAREIERREQSKQDYIADTTRLFAKEVDGDLRVELDNNGNSFDLSVNHYAERQVAERSGIPASYYDRMASIDGLRALNINAWWKNKPEKRMVRTLDNNVRAFLSDRFKPFDNYLVINSFLPVIQNMNFKIKFQILTDKRMYLQLLFPQIEAEIKKGDIVQAGLVITNSEVGAGAVDVKQVIWRLVCSNGMIGDSVYRRYHVGRSIGNTEDDYNIYQDDTIMSELNTFKLKLRDTVKNALSETTFLDVVNKMKKAAEDEIPDIPKAVENVTKCYTEIQEKDNSTLMNYIIDDGNRNRWGLANSITYLAQQIEDRDRSYDLEKLGHKIINISDAEWEDIVKN